jgi:diguanylate cyclase (GGDEF)-like protein/PAS domain S-box-containing protein
MQKQPEGPRRQTLLVVDDDSVMRMLEREALVRFEFDVREAVDGEQALEMMAESPPELVLLDVDMPGMDGFEVCRRIRQRWDATEVPVIMVTGMGDLQSINHAYESGANDFIGKPINWPSLGHRARYVLRSSQAARNLRKLEEKQAAIVRAMPDMIFLIARDGTYLDFKDGYGSQPFVPPEGVVGRNMAELLPPEVAAIFARGMALALGRGELQSAHFQLPMQDGMHHYEARIVPSGAETVVAVVRDITSQKLDEERIHRLAYFDALTELPNREHFIERVDRELARARLDNRQMALLFLDLDGFKRINDTLGHAAGDSLLKSVASRLRENLRAGDVMARPTPGESALHCARLGGDEFTILLPELKDIEFVKLVARRTLAVLNRPIRVGDQEITISASIGIAIFPDDGHNAADLVKHADTAMYHAKDQGRNNWQMYDAALTTKAVARLNLENDLRKGLELGQFRLEYQPQIQARDGSITGMEALIRWQHPTRGLVLPDDFIPAAEESGLIVPIGEWVIRTACSQLKAWQLAGVAAPRVAVNLSARQLRTAGFFRVVAAIIAETGVSADMLELELTESILMEPDAQLVEELERLHELGVHFAIDDFGTGYSSLNYVKRLPIGTVKIDRSFVRGLAGNNSDAGIATAILAMARSLGLDVIAEGVETVEQRAFLQSARCPKLQGYLFGPPVSPEIMEGILRQGSIAVTLKAAAA